MKKNLFGLFIIAIYIFLIYSTLPVIWLILNFLYAFLEQKFLTIILSYLYHFFINFSFFLIFLIIQIEKPAERIHFLEYGILGFLFLK